MKTIFKITIFFVSILSLAQEKTKNSKEIVIYKTYKDFKENNGEHLGTFTGDYANKLYYINKDGKNKKKAINKYWGFSVGQNVFRFKRGWFSSPMFIRAIKDKVFYYDGEMILSMILYDSNSGSAGNARHLIMYSDDLNSTFIDIKKFPKKERENLKFTELIPCIEKGLKRYGYNPQFQSITTCIDSFLSKKSD